MILNENLFENKLEESVHELVSIKVPGYSNTWTSFDNYDVTAAPGVVKRYFILENDKWGDETVSLVVSQDLSEVYETYDDIETCLRDEGIIDNLSESIEDKRDFKIGDLVYVNNRKITGYVKDILPNDNRINDSDMDIVFINVTAAGPTSDYNLGDDIIVRRYELTPATNEDIEKTSKGTWVNRGKEGTHGEFKTKKAAREQQKAMYARGFKGESLGSDIAEYQKWVDYDMKKYGRISSITNEKIRKAGLKVVKDKYGDYEVIANEPVKNESLTEAMDKFDKLYDELVKIYLKPYAGKDGFWVSAYDLKKIEQAKAIADKMGVENEISKKQFTIDDEGTKKTKYILDMWFEE